MEDKSTASSAAKPIEDKPKPEVVEDPSNKLTPPEGKPVVADADLTIEKVTIADALLDTPVEDKTKPTEPEPVYPVYNDADADSVVSMLRKAKISVADAEQIFAPAAKDGDLAKIPLADLEQRIGKEEAALVVAAARSYWARKSAEIKTQAAELHAIAGGEAQWNSVVAWAQKRAQDDPKFASELNEYRELLSSSHASARLAVKDLSNRYKTERGGVIKMVEGDNAGTAGVAPAKLNLTRAEYARKLTQLETAGKKEEAALLRTQWRKENNK